MFLIYTGTGGSSSKLIPILVPTIAGAVILSIIVALLLVKKTSSKRKKTHTSLIGNYPSSCYKIILISQVLELMNFDSNAY